MCVRWFSEYHLALACIPRAALPVPEFERRKVQNLGYNLAQVQTQLRSLWRGRGNPINSIDIKCIVSTMSYHAFPFNPTSKPLPVSSPLAYRDGEMYPLRMNWFRLLMERQSQCQGESHS